MATYEKRGKSWRVQVMRNGVRDSATFRTKAEAEFWADGRVRAPRGTTTLLDALTLYSRTVSPTKRGSRWEQVRIAAFLRDLPFLARPIDRIGPDDISDWRDARLKQVSAATVGRELTILSAVFQWAKLDRRWVQSNPCHAIRWPTQPPPRKRRVSPAEVKQVLAALGYAGGEPQSLQHQVAIAFLLAIETAMRAGELLSLAPEQVFYDRRYAHLDKTKNGDSRDVPLSKEAIRLLKLLTPHAGRMFQLRSGSLDTLFRKARDKAGLGDLHFHDTRREACTRLSKKLQPFELAAMSGHRSLATLLKTYYSPEPMEAAKKLD